MHKCALYSGRRQTGASAKRKRDRAPRAGREGESDEPEQDQAREGELGGKQQPETGEKKWKSKHMFLIAALG